MNLPELIRIAIAELGPLDAADATEDVLSALAARTSDAVISLAILGCVANAITEDIPRDKRADIAQAFAANFLDGVRESLTDA